MFRFFLCLIVTSVASSSVQEQGFEPLDPECLTAGRLLICSQYSSGMFDACVKTSQLHMFFYHRPSGQVCGGPTLGACVSGDFCDQPTSGDVIPPETAKDVVLITDYSQTSPVPQALSSGESQDNVDIQFRSFPVEDDSRESFLPRGVSTDQLPSSTSGDKMIRKSNQDQEQRRNRKPITELGSIFIAIIVLGSIVMLLFFAIVIFMVRDARHRTQRNMLGHMLYQAQQDRAQWLDFFSLRREAEQFWEPREAAEDAEAAAKGQVVPVRVPLSVRQHLVPEDRKKLQTFGIETAANVSEDFYPNGINPFGDNLSSTSSLPLQEQPPSQGKDSLVSTEEDDSHISSCPQQFAAASAGIRSKLADVFEPREVSHQENVVQPVHLAVQAEVHADVHTASIKRRPSCKKRQAPPPPSLPKPKPDVATAARGATSTKTLPKNLAKTAPSPPRRSSSLRSLNNVGRNSLRRAHNIPLQASKQDFSSEFLERNDLYTEEEQFVSHVTDV